MRHEIGRFLENWLPPGLLSILRGMGGGIRWSGNYTSWAEARSASTGYDSRAILKKVLSSLLKVKNGEAVYERDSVLFDEIEYSWPLLAGLMWIAAQNGGKLNVLDFGGSLGSSYFQNRKFLKTLSDIQWNIVEQEAFVEAGKEHFEDHILRFYHDIDSCMRDHSPNTILFGSVIQYLEAPYTLLEHIKILGFEYILFDRTPFVHGQKDRLTIQKTSRAIYPASYPCWFFSKDRFRAFFREDYETIVEFDSIDRANIPSTFGGIILRKR